MCRATAGDDTAVAGLTVRGAAGTTGPAAPCADAIPRAAHITVRVGILTVCPPSTRPSAWHRRYAGGFLPDGDRQVHRDVVDFVIDGRPLLFRLSDVDAVSPLASDIPPAILTPQVRGLLLEGGAPLEGGRRIIHACPECQDLACGAVTAVVEKDGDDFVWRDLAWQTDRRVDLERNGYHGIGPFRFRGDE
ncbi:hypothetical protein [Streptomyces sp. NPDC003710]